MTPETRKLIGTLGLLLFLLIYAFLAMGVAMALQINDSRLAELVYYVVAGTVWVLPAAWLVSWMYRTG